MTISSVGSVTVQSESVSSLSQLSEDYDQFMNILVAQIKYQDPLEPMDSTEFVSQTAQLTSVEQEIRANEQLELLRSELSVNGALYETALIGKTVSVGSSTVLYDGSPAEFSYELSQDSSGVVAMITDAEGNIIRTLSDLSGEAGRLHDISWDGLNDNGEQAASGTYNIELSSDTETGTYSTFKTSNVTAVEYTGGHKLLRLEDGTSVLSGDVVRAS